MDKTLKRNLFRWLAVLLVLICAVVLTYHPTSDESAQSPENAEGLIPNTGDDEAPSVKNEIGVPESEALSAQQPITYTAHYWVDAVNGNDANNGTTSETAFRTIQHAADIAQPGTLIHILPGVYRETIQPAASGTLEQPITYLAEDGLGSVIIRGSEPSASLTWTQLTVNSIGLPTGVDPANIYVADLSYWGLDKSPRFIVLTDDTGSITSRLSPAREPDWQVATEWKVSEFWWSANGGSTVVQCDPTTYVNNDCDTQSRSFTQLTDTQSDTDPAGIEAGSLKTLGSLVGATLVAMDTQHAHYVYRRTITQHDVANGRVTVDENCDNDGGPGLGWGSKYYLENHPALLDQPGEWWYDSSTGKLYLWTPEGGNPGQQKIEISHLDTGFNFSNISYTILDGLTIELYNDNAFVIDNEGRTSAAFGDHIQNSLIQYANKGIVLYQYVQGEDSHFSVDGFTLENSEIAQMDSTAFDSSFWWPDAPTPAQFTYAGVRNITLRNNEFHHLGFNSEDRSAVGIRIFFPDMLRFEGNSVHHVAQNGVHLHLSLVDSDKVYDLSSSEIKLGGILIKDNLFEKSCLAASDCGGLKIGGSNRPYTHVFRDVLITGNIFRNNYGWSYVSTQRQLNTYGDGNGFYLDYASGIHLYRNIAYNNSGAGYKFSCLWRDGETIVYNNLSANNYFYGFKFTGYDECDDHSGSVNTRLVNNILINNGGYGFQFISGYDDDAGYGNLTIDHNLYFQNGWDADLAYNHADIQLYRGTPATTYYFTGLAEIRGSTPWEDSGVQGDPVFLNYNTADHTRYADTIPDFHPSSSSTLLQDTGTQSLPNSLIRLLGLFGITDYRCGGGYDIGPYEISEPLAGLSEAEKTIYGEALGTYCQKFENLYLPAVFRNAK